jgi:hypothetical protein
MEQNNIKNIIFSNFSKLGKDEFILLANMLSLEDLSALCKSSKEIKQYCYEYKLFENRSRKYVMDATPLSEPIYSFKNQVELIKRGFSSVYTIVFGLNNIGTLDNNLIKEVRFGLPNQYIMEKAANNNTPLVERPFEIKGLPPKKGTEVYIVGYIFDEGELEDKIGNFFHYLQVYENSVELLTELFIISLPKVEPARWYNVNDDLNFAIMNLASIIIDDVYIEYGEDIDEKTLIKLSMTKFDKILKKGTYGSAILKKIRLP